MIVGHIQAAVVGVPQVINYQRLGFISRLRPKMRTGAHASIVVLSLVAGSAQMIPFMSTSGEGHHVHFFTAF